MVTSGNSTVKRIETRLGSGDWVTSTWISSWKNTFCGLGWIKWKRTGSATITSSFQVRSNLAFHWLTSGPRYVSLGATCTSTRSWSRNQEWTANVLSEFMPRLSNCWRPSSARSISNCEGPAKGGYLKLLLDVPEISGQGAKTSVEAPSTELEETLQAVGKLVMSRKTESSVAETLVWWSMLETGCKMFGACWHCMELDTACLDSGAQSCMSTSTWIVGELGICVLHAEQTSFENCKSQTSSVSWMTSGAMCSTVVLGSIKTVSEAPAEIKVGFVSVIRFASSHTWQSLLSVKGWHQSRAPITSMTETRETRLGRTCAWCTKSFGWFTTFETEMTTERWSASGCCCKINVGGWFGGVGRTRINCEGASGSKWSRHATMICRFQWCGFCPRVTSLAVVQTRKLRWLTYQVLKAGKRRPREANSCWR